jgi:hypothetical protein
MVGIKTEKIIFFVLYSLLHFVQDKFTHYPSPALRFCGDLKRGEVIY